MRWFRLYSEVLHDPKVQRLSPPLFRTWVNLLCLANEQEDRGNLPPLEDVAFALRVNPAKARLDLEALKKAGLLDDESEHVRPHGWLNRQKDSDNAAERMANKRRTSSEQSSKKFGLDGDGEGDENEKRPEGDGERNLASAALSPRHPRRVGNDDWDFIRSHMSAVVLGNGQLDEKGWVELRGYYDRLGAEWTLAAVNAAALADKPGYGYVRQVLENSEKTGKAPSTLQRRPSRERRTR
jgi:hypothetical protein